MIENAGTANLMIFAVGRQRARKMPAGSGRRNFYERAKNEMLVFERDKQLSIEDFPEVMP